ncbi:MAG: autotransporter domain-containing protein [Akkermansia sp.]|nr:autotransporter domain-containing protein [Akkermansia sp.]
MKPRLTRSLLRFIAGVVVCSAMAQADDLTWNGEATSNTWNTDSANTNWQNAGVAAPFVAGDNVTFSAPAGVVVDNVQVGEALEAGTVKVDDDYTFTTTAESSISGNFAGSGSIRKAGDFLLTLQAGDATTDGPALAVEGGNLALAGTATYRELTSMAEGTQLQVQEGADVTFANAATGTDVALQGTMRLASGDSTFNSVNGAGAVDIAADTTLALAADSSVGTLSNAGTVTAAGNLLVQNAVEAGGDVSAARLILNNGGTFSTLKTDNLVLGSAISKTAPSVTTATLGSANGSDMQVDVTRLVRGSGDYLLVSATDMGDTNYTLSEDTVNRFRNSGFLAEMTRGTEGLVLTLDSFNNGFYAANVRSSNARAGATLLDQAFADLDPQENRTAHPNLARVLDTMDAYILAGNSTAADRLAANVAGAGVANLNAAWRGQMERQLRAIRNRMTSFQGGMPCCPPDPKAPVVEPLRYTFWANAEMDYQNQSGEGTLPGYKLHSIGGTAGFAMLAAEDLTIGAAFTGMAGRLSSKGYGSDASGDLDAYYANIFMRKDVDCVQHSLIGSVGWADISFKRRVGMPGGGYATRGTTDGLGFGVMYEVARSYRISEDTMKSAWWQPVFNVAYVHSKVDAYTESGSDAALRVGKQDSNNVIFGFGARMQGIVGEGIFNTPAMMEARILGKGITGGRRGKADVSIPGVAASSTVRGSESSAMGVELGIGFNIPLGRDYGALITDFTAEFYQDQTSVNGVLGYRIDF